MRYLLTHAITQAAERRPESQAIGYQTEKLTYAELESRTNSLARTLIDQGVKRGDRVGIYMNKGLESAVAIYGILKAGAAYVPLDPFAPLARLSLVIQDCGIRHLVTKDARQPQVAEMIAVGAGLEFLLGMSAAHSSASGEMKTHNSSWEEIQAASDQPVNLNLTEQDLAYILYTSGSTGIPKGIMHTHRSGLSFAEWAAHEYGLTKDDRLSNHAPLHFDLSTFDFFAGAIAGAATIVIPEVLTKFPANLSKLMQDERISVWYSVPFALMQMMERGLLETRDLRALRWLLFAGEVFPTKHLRNLITRLKPMVPGLRFSNLYGPTETNVCTYYHVDQISDDDDQTIPIGKACLNVEDLVVDADGRPVAEGEVGELLIRGGVVMKGYWGQPEKTASGFYRRSMFGQFDDIFYHTGDLVHLDADGNYRYLGRKDRQIKTRGYRVELDEVEVALLSHPGVDEAAVYPVPDGQGSNLIEAAVILKTPGLLLDELIAHISTKLPSYAIPVRIDIKGDFPRTSTGKINRRELQSQAAERLK